MRQVIRILLSGILGVAGLLHLVTPHFFLPAMPPYIPLHTVIIYTTGFLELAASVSLWIPKLHKVASWCLVVYFVAILPAHFHVAINQIPIFGISNPTILWARTLFQSVFIAAAYFLTREKHLR